MHILIDVNSSWESANLIFFIYIFNFFYDHFSIVEIDIKKNKKKLNQNKISKSKKIKSGLIRNKLIKIIIIRTKNQN